jgi:hypothetical protein
MFKNRHFQVKIAKDDAIPEEDFEVKTVDPAEIAQIAVESTIKIATVVGGVVAANRVLKTICEVAVIAAKAKIK